MAYTNNIPAANDNISTSQDQIKGNFQYLADTTGTNNPNPGEGYYKFPNGILIQWGSTVSSGNTTRTINFPIAFGNSPNPPWSIQLTPFGNDTNTASDCFIADNTANDNTFFILKNRSGFSQGFYWFAIGPQ